MGFFIDLRGIKYILYIQPKPHDPSYLQRLIKNKGVCNKVVIKNIRYPEYISYRKGTCLI